MRAIPLSPGRSERFLASLGSASVLLMMLYPDDPGYPSSEAVLVRYGLTPAQARIAALVGEGLTLNEIADRLGNSVHTVRTTLKQIFLRLGVHRQADLARLVARTGPFSR